MERLDPRTVWPNEAADFTPWLAKHIETLAETLGVTDDLEVVDTERFVGPYRADLICKSVERDIVLIENQLGATDHSHLGQLITYGAGVGASTVVWIADRFNAEHRAALDWLNASTAETDFFGLEIEVWRIGDSEPAPKFNIVAKPNDWSRVTARKSRGEVSETNRLYFAYWTAFHEVLQQAGGPARPRSPRASQYMSLGVGRAGFTLAAAALKSARKIRAMLYISNESADAYFTALKKQKDQIEAELGFGMDWQGLEGKKACRVAIEAQFDPADESTWSEQHEWLAGRLNRMHQVLAARIRELEPTVDEIET